MDIDSLLNSIDSSSLSIPFGRIKHISSTTIKASGIEVAVGDIVRIESQQHIYSVLGMVASIESNDFTIVPFSLLMVLEFMIKYFYKRMDYLLQQDMVF